MSFDSPAGGLIYVVLFLVSLLHEETAMIGGGFLISERGEPMITVSCVLIAGLIVGDWAIYGFGAAAQRVPTLKRWRRSELACRSRQWMQEHLLLVIVIARVFPGPGILFPTFGSLGLIGVPFGRFAARSALVAAVYAPAMLYLTTVYGNLVVPYIGWWAWPALIVLSIMSFVGPWARPLRRRVVDFIGLRAIPEASGSTAAPYGNGPSRRDGT
jgi:membrane protein DedA with SNARE-associated domain